MSRRKPGTSNRPQATPRPSPGVGASLHPTTPWLAGALLVIVTVAAYLPAAQCGFVWDDDDYVQHNETLPTLDGLGRIWFEIGATKQYYPLVHTSYWLEYRLWGQSPAGYHVVNVLLHAIGAVFLWRVLLALQLPAAWLAAAVFALHPVHVESVAWITERKNVLSGAFYLASALSYLHFIRGADSDSDRPPSYRLYGVALLFFLCALLSKTVTCSLPAALLLALWWKRGRIRIGDISWLLPLFVMGFAAALVTTWMERHHVLAVGSAWDLSLVDRFLIAGRALFFYLGKLLWPLHLTFTYPRWRIDAEAFTQYVFPVAAAATFVGMWLARRRMGRGPLVAALFFAGTLVPALGFFDVYPMRYSFVADHFQYLASIGPIALVTAAAYRLADRRGHRVRRVAMAVAVLLLTTLGALTWRQTRAYESLETLWRDTLQKNPAAWMAHNNLGVLLQEQGRVAEATVHLRRAIELDPGYAEAHNNLGAILQSQGQSQQAVRYLERAIRIDPDYADAHVNLGVALRSRGRLDEAVEHYRRALRISPDRLLALVNLGNALLAMGRMDEALSHYRRAIEIAPGNAGAHLNLGVALRGQGKLDEALGELRKTLTLAPELPAAHLEIGLTLGAQGKIDQAIEAFHSAIRLNPRSLPAHLNLGHALLSAASIDDAVEAYRAALRINPAHPAAQRALEAALAAQQRADE